MPEALLEPRRLCAAEELVDGGAGVRFAVRLNTRRLARSSCDTTVPRTAI
jgi:hypothetical protein